MKRTVLLLACVIAIVFLNAQTLVNDEYTGALEVIPSVDATCRSTTSGTTIGATQSMPGCFGSAEDDIWFKFTATSNRHRIVVTGDIINHVLELFNLSAGNLTSIACRYLTNPSSYGGLTAEFNTLIPGTTYYYRVYGSGNNSQRGQISNCIISPPPPPANDECNGAIALPVNADDNCTNVYSGQFGYASQSFPALLDKGYDAFDIWFKFTATAASHRIRLTYDDNNTTPLMQAFSGDCNNLVSIGYFTPAVQYQTQPVVGTLTNLTPGNTYYIRIYNDGSVSRPNETIGLCISSPLGAPGYQYPIVSLTSPANGSILTAPTSINLTTTVVEGEEPVQKVEFFYREGLHGDIKLGEDLTAPYEFNWNNVFPGQYKVTAKATDLIGATAISTIDITVNTPPTNQLPTVNLYAYRVGSGIAPGTILLNVMAQDPDGTIAKIEIYQNGVLVYEIPQSVANLGFTGLSSGGYMYQAKAIDNQGGSILSQLIPLSIYEKLSVKLTANFTALATVNLEATPSGGDGTFSKVEFYNGTTKLGEDLTAPYTFNWTNVAAGTYFLTAKVFHNMGDSAVSPGIQVTACPSLKPVITVNGPLNFCNGGSVTLTSSAATNNQWYKDDVAINGATNQSYVVSAAGTYKVVHSDACGSSTSDPVAITTVCTSGITFTLVNSTNDLDIQTLKDGDNINLATIASQNLNIRANSASSIGSVVFNLSGAQSVSSTESVAPYALFGDNSGDYNNWTPAVGSYTLKATPFSGGGGTGTAGTAATINFKVVNIPANAIPIANAGSDKVVTQPASSTTLNGSGSDANGSIVSYAWTQVSGPNTATITPNAAAQSPTVGSLVAGTYIFSLIVTDNQGAVSIADSVTVSVVNNNNITLTLVNSINDLDIQTLKDGDSINLATLSSTNLNIRANSASSIGSVVFNLSGAQTVNQTESVSPYALFGDNSGDYNNWTPAVGNYTLKATPFSGAGGTGTAGTAATINFKVINKATNLPPTANAGPDFSVTLPTNDATLSGFGTDADGTIAGYQWYQVSGPNPNLVSFIPNSQQQKLIVTGLIQGTYIFAFVVTDNQGATSKADSVTVSVVNNNNITLTLVNSINDLDIQTLKDGDSINLATLSSTNLNIRANSVSSIGSMVFNLTGAQTVNQTESVSPYALFGDNSGDYNNWTPAVGNYTLKATPFSGGGGTGTAGTAATINFKVINKAPNGARMASQNINAIVPHADQLNVYPNPSITGHFTISLPHKYQGEISYSLVSMLGRKITVGKLLLKEPTSTVNFDFSHRLITSGVYYLILEGKGLKKLHAKLMKN